MKRDLVAVSANGNSDRSESLQGISHKSSNSSGTSFDRYISLKIYTFITETSRVCFITLDITEMTETGKKMNNKKKNKPIKINNE